jgi:SAM-dependent methyltransferase
MDTYSDADNADLYDTMCGWDDEYALYHAYVMESARVLDVGCGPGTVLRRARADGHSGRLVGVDPNGASLDRARALGPGVEWIGGSAAGMAYDAEFDFAMMSANAFQCFVGPAEIAASLRAIRAALAPGGRFVFTTRNPARRDWERWRPEAVFEMVDHEGRALTGWYEVTSVEDGVVTFTDYVADADRRVLRADEGRLQFLEPDALAAHLGATGFTVTDVYGDFDRPFAPDSRLMLVAAAADA